MLQFSIFLMDEIPRRNQVGSKAFQLFRLHRAGFRVPPFLVIHAEAVSVWMQKMNETCALENRQTDCRAILEGVIQNDENLERFLEEAERIAGTGEFLSVRSSALIEDGKLYSYAGRFHTALYVRNKELITAIANCLITSLDQFQIGYTDEGGQKGEFSMAVIVQRMIDADRSGVAFSMHPNGNLADICIVAAHGIGEGVVRDIVESDMWTVNRITRNINPFVTIKKHALQYDKGLQFTSVPESLQAEPVCSAEELIRLTEQIMRVEQLIEHPVDIEFCFSNEKELFLLQARPITTIKTEVIKVLDNTNIVESYPGISLPLTFDFAQKAYAAVFRRCGDLFMLSKKQKHLLTPVFAQLIAHPYGRIYYRLDNWYRMVLAVHRTDATVRHWEKAVGLASGPSDSQKKETGFWRKVKTALLIVRLLVQYQLGNKRFYANFKELYQSLSALSRSGMPFSKASWKSFSTLSDRLFTNWIHTIVNDFIAFQTYGQLTNILEKAQLGHLAHSLVLYGKESTSEMAYNTLLDLSAQVRNDTDLMAIFLQSDKSVLLSLDEVRWTSFRARFDDYIQQYGDRTFAELKLEIKAPRQSPEILVQMIRMQLDKIPNQNAPLKSTARRRKALHTLKMVYPVWHPKFAYIRFLSWLAAYGLHHRENMRFCRARGFGAVKDYFLQLGNWAVEQKLLEAPEDVFYLQMEEIEKMVGAADDRCFGDLVNERKKEFEDYAHLTIPERIMYTDTLPVFEKSNSENLNHSQTRWCGLGVSPGVVSGQVVVIDKPDFKQDIKGKILITKMTDPGWVYLMTQAAGIICEKGSLLSHTAIVGREIGIPVVVNIQDATRRIVDGSFIRMDGRTGMVLVIEDHFVHEPNEKQ
jgi:phosphohistidine swiveling domain-containing protein